MCNVTVLRLWDFALTLEANHFIPTMLSNIYKNLISFQCVPKSIIKYVHPNFSCALNLPTFDTYKDILPSGPVTCTGSNAEEKRRCR